MFTYMNSYKNISLITCLFTYLYDNLIWSLNSPFTTFSFNKHYFLEILAWRKFDQKVQRVYRYCTPVSLLPFPLFKKTLELVWNICYDRWTIIDSLLLTKVYSLHQVLLFMLYSPMGTYKWIMPCIYHYSQNHTEEFSCPKYPLCSDYPYLVYPLNLGNNWSFYFLWNFNFLECLILRIMYVAFQIALFYLAGYLLKL